ncbi:MULTISPECIES: histidinol-phosphate transaminase [Paenibacillus]|uniref:histidinol-phosphate transaminase n=1 Tax=Paenibacillus TaxID=44249 RepID=UPI0022B913B2|nr:histidinol-phosphate transaminase [Paenibacillus caseinilyticus]MCZ8524040.1 histidinol-phosphate transaminase [Paenibacillus caseinilyticus]
MSKEMKTQTGEGGVQPRGVLARLTPYSPGKPIWEVQQELGLQEVVKLASNENPLGPSPKAVEAASALLTELHRYPDAAAVRLREAIAVHTGLSEEELIVTNGGDELLTLIAQTFLDPGDEVIVPDPTFSEYAFGTLLMNAEVVRVPLGEGFRYDVDALLRAVSERTKILWLCSPNNPTGTYLPAGELRRLLDSLRPGILVVYDAAYSHYVTADDYTDGLAYVQEGYGLVVLQTFSKIYGLAGLRVGFGAAPRGVIRHLLQAKEPFNVNTLAQTAAAAALTDKAHVEASRQLNEEGRLRLYAVCRELGLDYTGSMANFVLIRLGSDAQQACARLLSRGIILRYGGAWGLPEHVRISIGSHAEMDRLIDGLRWLAQGEA